jgi:F0F1-type ATP synthase assembly protein I
MNRPDYRWMRKAGPVWSIPFLIPISTVIGLLLGRWLDGVFGTKPWIAIALTLLGLASGIYESARILIEATRDENGD